MCVKDDVGEQPKNEAGAVRMKSKTDGLEMTALAAKYETSIEEVILRQLIRLSA